MKKYIHIWKLKTKWDGVVYGLMNDWAETQHNEWIGIKKKKSDDYNEWHVLHEVNQISKNIDTYIFTTVLNAQMHLKYDGVL